MNRKITALVQLLFAPVSFFMYAITLAITPQGFEDLVAVLMGMIGVISAAIVGVLYFLSRKMTWSQTWYARIAMSILSVILAFMVMIIFSRLSS